MGQVVALTPRQERFVSEYIVCGNGTEAARRAGYSERTARQIASENLSKLDIQAAIEAARRREAEYWQLQKHDVIAALLDAIKLAKEQMNPGAVIRGYVEIAKLLGYYQPETVRFELSDDMERLRAKFAVMSDEELLAVIANSSCQSFMT